MRNVYSVGQVNAYIKNMFTQDFVLNRIYVKGEVSNCKYHTSGHIYFSLKDATGAIACVMFSGQRRGLAFRMQEGQQVIVLGAVNVYERDGKYQLYAKEIILDGAGLLYTKYEQLKKELEDMGMFAEQYKQPVPKYIRTLGVVTAPTGAAVRDIMNITRRRNPYVQMILYPALVQGEGAAASIVKGIRTLDAMGVDTIIAGRGGGSIEDLWAFNEESVARAIFECRTPVISAVGHETDTTIVDYVADLRAPTPSAAAELAVFDYELFREQLEGYWYELQHRLRLKLSDARSLAKQYQMRLSYVSPKNQIREKRLLTAELMEKLSQGMNAKLLDRRHRLSLYIEKFHGLSPLGKLNQGYSYTENDSGQAVTGVEQVHTDEMLQIHVRDGKIRAKVCGTEKIRRIEDEQCEI